MFVIVGISHSEPMINLYDLKITSDYIVETSKTLSLEDPTARNEVIYQKVYWAIRNVVLSHEAELNNIQVDDEEVEFVFNRTKHLLNIETTIQRIAEARDFLGILEVYKQSSMSVERFIDDLRINPDKYTTSLSLQTIEQNLLIYDSINDDSGFRRFAERDIDDIIIEKKAYIRESLTNDLMLGIITVRLNVEVSEKDVIKLEKMKEKDPSIEWGKIDLQMMKEHYEVDRYILNKFYTDGVVCDSKDVKPFLVWLNHNKPVFQKFFE
jgi:hypothetical protein